MGNCKYELQVKGMRYLEAIIDKELLLENSDDYIRACLAHYELASEGIAKTFELKRYLSWVPFNLASAGDTKVGKSNKIDLIENFNSTIDRFRMEMDEINKGIIEKEERLEQKVEIIEEKIVETDEKIDKIDKKMDEMNGMMAKILANLEKKPNPE
jgi:septal ring factor EnvC (AmiA/AmiB activator)